MWASMSVSVRERQREYTFQRRLHTNGCVRVSEMHVWVHARARLFIISFWEIGSPTRLVQCASAKDTDLTPLTLALARSKKKNMKDRLD